MIIEPISAFQHSRDQKVEELDTRVCEIVKLEISFFEKGRGHVWRLCAGESSCLVHVCVGGFYGKGPMDQIHVVPVRAERTILVLRI
jgi:hypothetical protein